MSNTSLLGSFGGQAGDALFFRNRIVNGAMVIDQRNAGASVTPTNGQYTLDRWRAGLAQASKFTVQQSAVAPAGFTNSILVTSSSAYSVGSSEAFNIAQFIEGFNVADLGWGTSAAQSVTLSFWVRSSLTGTFGGSIQNDGVNRSYPFTYSISAANTWEYKTVTIAGDTTGTWLTNSGIGMRVWWSIGTGASSSSAAGSWAAGDFRSATGATSVVGTNGATLYLTGVQLESGAATPFERRPIGVETALCQRYTVVYGGSANYEAVGSLGVAFNATQMLYFNIPLPIEMRSTPNTVTISGSWRLDDGYLGAVAVTSIGIATISINPKTVVININCASGLTAGRVYQFQTNNSTASRLIISAEL